MNIFKGKSANEVWKLAFSSFGEDNKVRLQQSRGGSTHELLHVALSIKDPRQRWVTSRMPALNPAFAIAEIVWILRGRNDATFLTSWNRQLEQYAGKGPTFHGAYGYRLRRQFGIDQLERVFLALDNDPTSRQAVLQMWDPSTDMPTAFGQAASSDIPCNVSSFLKIREGKLEWMQIMRSNDLFRGTPYNFIQFTSLQEIIAGWLGISVGEYVHISDSLHLYESDAGIASVDIDLEDQPNTDSLCVSKQESDEAFAELEARFEALADGDASVDELLRNANCPHIPPAYQNLLTVVGAEALRKKSEPSLVHDLMLRCTNPMLHQAWSGWEKRLQRIEAER